MSTTKARKPPPDYETELWLQMLRDGLPMPRAQFYFAKAIKRRWRADFAWPDPQHMLIVEVEGATWVGGRHVTGAGFEADCLKYAEAVLLGYRVLRVTGGMVCDRNGKPDGRALDLVRRALLTRKKAA